MLLEQNPSEHELLNKVIEQILSSINSLLNIPQLKNSKIQLSSYRTKFKEWHNKFLPAAKPTGLVEPDSSSFFFLSNEVKKRAQTNMVAYEV